MPHLRKASTLAVILNCDNMGFHITLKKADGGLFKKLSTSPTEIFGRPYAGHIIFIVGASDTDTFDYLKNNLVELDSLTGNTIAYTLVAKQLRITLSIDEFYSEKRRPNYLGEYEVSRIDELIRKNKFRQDLADGDYLDALTYGSDILARHFEVIDQMPCALIFDGRLDENFIVLPLNNYSQDKLITILRKAISILTKNEKFIPYIKSLQIIGTLQEEIRSLIDRIQNLKTSLEEIPSDFDVPLIITKNDNEVIESLKKGSHRGFRKTIEKIEEEYKLDVEFDLTESQGGLIAGLAKTIQELRSYQQLQWPLDSFHSNKLVELIASHVNRLVQKTYSQELKEVGELDKILVELSKIQDETIADVIGKINLDHAVRAGIAKMKSELSDKQNNLEVQLREKLIKSEEVIYHLSDEKHPSFQEVIKDILRKEKIENHVKSVSSSAKTYVGKFFDPSTLIKLVETGVKIFS